MRTKILMFFFSILILTGCASVPKQVVDAVQLQKTEIAHIKAIYFDNINNQLDAIEKYRYAILDIYEQQYINKKTKSFGVDGTGKVAKLPPTTDADFNYINIVLLEDISKFFEAEREKVRIDIQKRREQIRLINKNFENIEQLNNALDEYMQSLKRLSNSQENLAKSIGERLKTLIPIPLPALKDIPDPKTVEDLIKTLK